MTDAKAIMDPNGTLSSIGIEEPSLPSWLAQEHPDAKYLDVSNGNLRRFDDIDGFSKLTALIADQNEVSSLDSFPVMEDLHTLSLNKNKLLSVDNIVRNAAEKFPKLAFLSLLGNPCCPSDLVGGTAQEYSAYRKQLVEGIHTVRFIDSRPVLDTERPHTVEHVTERKLRTGHISLDEHEHIMKMHALINSLDDESTDMMLASSDEEDEDDEGEYQESPQQEYFASILAAARGVSEGTEKPADSKAVKKTAIDMGGADDDLSVFEKIVSVSLPTSPMAPAAAPKRPPATKAKPSPVRKTGPVPPVPTPKPAEPEATPSASRPAPQPSLAQLAKLKVPPPPATDSTTDAQATAKVHDGGDAAEHGYTDEPLYDSHTTEHYPEFVGEDRKLKIAALMGEVRTVPITKSPTGLDMHLVVDTGYIRVAQVVPKGAAHKAGIQVGDLILAAGDNGIVGCSEEDAVAFMLESTTTQLQVASLSISLPDFAAPRLAQRKYSIGAVSPSAAIRPLYCELELQPQSDGTLGFTVNMNGPEPLVDTVDSAVIDIKPGDVVKSINGDEVNSKNVVRLMKDAVVDPPITVDVIRYMIEDGGLAGAEKHFDLLTRYYAVYAPGIKTPAQLRSLAASMSTSGVDATSAAMKEKYGVSLIDFRDQAAATAAGSPTGQEPMSPGPGCQVFECTFKGRSELEKGGGKSRQMVKAANKKAKRDAKVARKGSSPHVVLSEAETFAKGKVKVAVFSDSITCKRFSKVPKSLQALKGKLDEVLVFEVNVTDAFTVIRRKRKLVIMVQSDVEGRALCYILKFGKKRDCDKTYDAIADLPGHVRYTPPKQLKKQRKSKSDVKASKASATSPLPVPEPAADEEKPAEPAAPRRRKLVRGANAVVIGVLPEFTAAMSALEELDKYLDTVLSSDKKLATTSAHLATGQVAKGKSRKWMRQAAKSFKIQTEADERRMSTVSTAPTTMDDSSAEDDDDLDDLEADDEFFNALEEKRQERAKEQESRRIALQKAAAEVRGQLNNQRAVDLESIGKEKELERQRDEEYKEYCAIGAEKRLKELTFKFKWNGVRPQFIDDDDA